MVPAAHATITKDWRGYKVAFPHGAQEYAVNSIKSLIFADVVCDTLSVMDAVAGQRPLDSVRLRSRRSDQSRPLLSAAARLELEGIGFDEAVRQLQATVAGMARLPAGMSFPTAHTAAAAATHLLFGAAAGGHTAAAQLVLLVAPECATAADLHGCTALHAAASGCHLQAVRLLIRAAPDATAALSAADRNGCLPLHLAAAAHADGRAAVAALSLLLAEAPGTLAATTHSGELPLHLAVRATRWSKCTGSVQLLLQRAPADASTAGATDAQGRTPLHVAAAAGHPPTIQLLLGSAAGTAGARDLHGQYPLHLAAAHGNGAAVQLLLQAEQAPPEALTTTGIASGVPLQLALGGASIQSLSTGRLEAVRGLIAAGPTSIVLSVLRQTAPTHGRALIPEAVATRVPLTAAEWDLVPFNCPQLGRALPAALRHSAEQTRHLMRRLPRSDLMRLRALALCLARVQQRIRAALPQPMLQHLLCLAVS